VYYVSLHECPKADVGFGRARKAVIMRVLCHVFGDRNVFPRRDIGQDWTAWSRRAGVVFVRTGWTGR